MTKSFSIALILIVFASCNRTSERTEATNKSHKSLETSITAILDSSEFVGIGVGVIRNGEIMYANGFGYSNRETQQKYSIESIQPIGSISKLFIGLALSIAIEQGHFDLETKINEILPFEISNPNNASSEIKILDLVTHTSGIVDSDLFWSNCYFIQDSNSPDEGTKHLIDQHLARDGDLPSLQELIVNYFKQGEKWFDASNFNDSKSGVQYEYTNAGSSLAAYLIEVKTGISFKDFCNKYIFKPLELNSTRWQVPKTQENMSILYKDKDTPIPPFQLSSYPDGGLHTTVEDLSIFMRAMIEGYEGTSNLMKPETFSLMFDKKFETLPDGYNPNTNSGIFWDWRKTGTIGHNGSDPGIFTDFSFDPETKNGTIILFNKEVIAVGEWKTQYKKFLKLKKILLDYEPSH